MQSELLLNQILITGGLGQIGSYLLEEIRRQYPQCDIVILDNLTNNKLDPDKKFGKLIKGDIENLTFVEGIFKKKEFDAVIHCAAQISISESVLNPISDSKINIIGTLNLLECSRKYNVPRFVTIGSAAVFGNPKEMPLTNDTMPKPISPYGVSKAAAEMYTMQYGKTFDLFYNVIRPFNVYSERMGENDAYSGVISKFIEFVTLGRPILIEGDGLQTRDFIHARDVAQITIKILESNFKGSVINAATGNPTTIIELSKIISSVYNVEWRIEKVSPRLGDIKHSWGIPPDFYRDFISLEEGIREMKQDGTN